MQRFHAEDIRFEVRDPDVLVIDCTWQSGTVHFNDCDDTANAFKDFSDATRPHRYRVGPRGPLIRYDSCQLVGRHDFQTRNAGAEIPTVVRYDMCLFKSHPQQSFAVADGTSLVDFVTFRDCVGS